MLHITLPGGDLWNETAGEFIVVRPQAIALEHSLVSISKWESKWKKPFLGKDPMSWEQCVDYIRCMTITQNVDPNAYLTADKKTIERVNAYIEDKMTATTIREEKGPQNNRIITSELIYAWMFELGIPMECQKWHLNRLLTLIRVCNIEKNGQNGKKLSASELAARNRSLNASRRAKYNSRG